MSGKYGSFKRLLVAMAVGGMVMFSPKVDAANGRNNIYVSYGYEKNDKSKIEYRVEERYKDCVYFREKTRNIEFLVKDKDMDGTPDEIYLKVNKKSNKDITVIYELKQKEGEWKVVNVNFVGDFPGTNIFYDEYLYHKKTVDDVVYVESYVNERINDFTQILDNFSDEGYAPLDYDPLHLRDKEKEICDEIWEMIISR